MAAACLASVAVGTAVPSPASAFPCADIERSSASSSNEDCSGATVQKQRTRKRGSASSVAVFVAAIAAVLLIPIGARGIPSSVDPYSRERSPYDDRNRRTR